MPDSRARNLADIRAVLDAWREQGADRVDPLRFGVIAALERRAHRYDGPVRELLQDRLTALVEGYASALAETARTGSTDAAGVAPHVSPDPGPDPGPSSSSSSSSDPDLGSGISISPGAEAGTGSSPLRELIEHIGASPKTVALPFGADEASAASTSAFPPLPALEEFQQLWDRIRTDSQLRQSLAAVPDGAGPLHSSALLHRAMTLMQEISPGYLQHFIAYVDALSWMERLQGDGVLETKAASRGTDSKSTGRPRARKRAQTRQV